MNTDPIADFLTRLRNGAAAAHSSVELPASKLKVALAALLLQEGYIRSYELREDKENNRKTLRILLKYDAQGLPVIREIKRVSRPGLRKYFKSANLPRILAGAGISIVSTNRGLRSDREARRDGLGGEVLCTVY